MELYYLCCNAIMAEQINEHEITCEKCCKHAKTLFDL